MLTGDGANNEDGLEPDLAQARRTANVAHGVVIRLKEIGLPQSLDGELASLSTDLGDLRSAETALAARLDEFLSTRQDWEAVGDYLVDLRASIDHIDWHLKSVRRPLNRITQFAYRRASEGEVS